MQQGGTESGVIFNQNIFNLINVIHFLEILFSITCNESHALKDCCFWHNIDLMFFEETILYYH